MNGTSERPSGGDAVRHDPFPDGVTGGSTVLVAGTVDPSTYAVGLRALCRYGSGEDTALAVTTTESADRATAAYDAACERSTRPVIGFVDAASEQPSVDALYDERPVVFVPAPGDLERIVLGLSELTEARPVADGSRHLLVRSLTPLLENASVEDVCAVLERIVGLRIADGLTLLGLDYTAHDEATMNALSDHADGVLWVTEPSDGVLEFEYEQGRDYAVSDSR